MVEWPTIISITVNIANPKKLFISTTINRTSFLTGKILTHAPFTLSRNNEVSYAAEVGIKMYLHIDLDLLYLLATILH
jgi:hypothetical protein